MFLQSTLNPSVWLSRPALKCILGLRSEESLAPLLGAPAFRALTAVTIRLCD